jgi:hypothetical protein
MVGPIAHAGTASITRLPKAERQQQVRVLHDAAEKLSDAAAITVRTIALEGLEALTTNGIHHHRSPQMNLVVRGKDHTLSVQKSDLEVEGHVLMRRSVTVTDPAAPTRVQTDFDRITERPDGALSLHTQRQVARRLARGLILHSTREERSDSGTFETPASQQFERSLSLQVGQRFLNIWPLVQR